MRFSALPEAERNKFIEDGCPIILQCELSDPTAQVYWYKDGTKLLSQSGMDIQSDGIKRTLLIQSAEISHGGTYECSTAGDIITFKVEIKGDLQLFFIYTTHNRSLCLYPHWCSHCLFIAIFSLTLTVSNVCLYLMVWEDINYYFPSTTT